MNWIKKLLAPASLAINVYSSKIQLQTIIHQCLYIPRAFSLPSKFSFMSYQKYCYMEESKYKPPSDIVHVTSIVNSKEDINCELQKLYVTDVSENSKINSGSSLFKDNDKSLMKKKYLATQKIYRDIRKWKKIDKANAVNSSKDAFILKLLSFNILAQDLLETHSYLYKEHDKKALPWDKRKLLLLQEILELDVHVICLQEVQEEHLKDFLIPFEENGFAHLYKKRTHEKKDGLLLLFKKHLFQLLDFSKVELYQHSVELLNRDNVGLVAKFSLIESPRTEFVVATTHLLFNPKRNDIRLGQVQVLFAEIERIAFIQNTLTGPSYLPIVLAGDFNLEPNSRVYKFIIDGSIEFVGKGRNLEKCDYRCLSNSLIPPHLYVTDECQHFNVLWQRLSGRGSGKVMLDNSENRYVPTKDDSPNDRKRNEPFNSKTSTYQKVEVADGHYVTFSSGLLTHPFRFQSVYTHTNTKGRSEVTTFQNRWITVDYIFYSKLQLLEKYTLPNADECSECFPTIPNFLVGSDHFCLGASFVLKK